MKGTGTVNVNCESTKRNSFESNLVKGRFWNSVVKSLVNEYNNDV